MAAVGLEYRFPAGPFLLFFESAFTMLTPAEELGLGGASLAGRVRKAFYTADSKSLHDLFQNIRRECSQRHVVYLRAGKLETIRLLPCPVTVLPDQIGYLHYASLVIHNALKRLPDLYIQDFAVRKALEFTEDEERWLWDCWGPSHQESNPVFGRLDAVVDFTSPMWKESLWFVEPNMSGIGGIHLAPMCEEILTELVFPLLNSQDGQLQLETGHDIRELLMQEMLDHLEAIGSSGRTVCMVEPMDVDSGIDEQGVLAEYYHERHGITVLHADPKDLEDSGGEITLNGVPVDLLYRDYSVLDLVKLERAGKSVEPMRRMFRENRIISSIAAELDQKNCWEIFTDPQFAHYFGADERQVFRRHIPWTRMLVERNTSLPGGHSGDLLEYVRSERETLVIKPNRSYGGEGVIIGIAASESEWDQAIKNALEDTTRWVVQQLVSIPVYEFPIIDEDGGIHLEPFYIVAGFAPTKYGVAILARASQKQVVNVAQRGGMCAIGIGRPPGRLIGPERLG